MKYHHVAPKLALIALAGAAGLLAADVVRPADPPADAQRVAYHLGQTPGIPVTLKWKTILVLPSSEKILDVVCGFKDEWDVYAPKDSNFAMVTPLKAGVKTDLAFVTKAGNIYTFALYDVSISGTAEPRPYTQVLIDAVDDKMRAALDAEPKYYGADEVAAFRAQAKKAEDLRAEVAAKAVLDVEASQGAAREAATKAIKHDYKYDHTVAAKDPWKVTSIWHDERFSYVEATPSEQFAIYEVVDGKPTAINTFPSGDGSFRTDRVLGSGYFKLGKRELKFAR